MEDVPQEAAPNARNAMRAERRIVFMGSSRTGG